MKKICLVFTGSQYESWNKNGIISKLNQNFQLEIFIVNPKEKFESLEKNVKIVIVQDPGKVIKALYDINQIQNLSKSKSFVFRLKRMYFGPADITNYSWKSFLFYKILSSYRWYNLRPFHSSILQFTPSLLTLFTRLLLALVYHPCNQSDQMARFFVQYLALAAMAYTKKMFNDRNK